MVDTSYPKLFFFFLKAMTDIIGHKYCQLFAWNFEQMVLQMPSPGPPSSPVSRWFHVLAGNSSSFPSALPGEDRRAFVHAVISSQRKLDI